MLLSHFFELQKTTWRGYELTLTLRRNVVVSLAAKENQGTPPVGKEELQEAVSGRLEEEIKSHYWRSYHVYSQKETLYGAWDYREVFAGFYRTR